MMCKKCGIELSGDRYFCTKCGKFLDSTDEAYIKSNKWRYTYYLSTLAWKKIMNVCGALSLITIAVFIFMYESHYTELWFLPAFMGLNAPFFLSVLVWKRKVDNLEWMIAKYRERHGRYNFEYKRTTESAKETAVRPS